MKSRPSDYQEIFGFCLLLFPSFHPFGRAQHLPREGNRYRKSNRFERLLFVYSWTNWKHHKEINSVNLNSNATRNKSNKVFTSARNWLEQHSGTWNKAARNVSINFFSLELHAVPKHSIKDVGRGEGRPVASSLFMLSQCQLSAHEITHQTPPMQTRHIKAKSNSFYVVGAFSLLSFALDVEELCLLEHKVMTSHYHTLGWLITVFPFSLSWLSRKFASVFHTRKGVLFRPQLGQCSVEQFVAQGELLRDYTTFPLLSPFLGELKFIADLKIEAWTRFRVDSR